MRKLVVLCFVALCFYGCPVDEDLETEYWPVLMERSTLEASVGYKEARPIQNPGKIYTINNWVFINEKYQGVHVIDNTDPKNPKNEGFISAAGCVDMAVKGGVLYLDNAVDLIAIDINTKTLIKRVKSAFPELAPPDFGSIPFRFSKSQRPANTIVVAWEEPEQ